MNKTKLVKSITKKQPINVSFIENKWGSDNVWNVRIDENGKAIGYLSDTNIIAYDSIKVKDLREYIQNVLKARLAYIEAGQLGFSF